MWGGSVITQLFDTHSSSKIYALALYLTNSSFGLINNICVRAHFGSLYALFLVFFFHPAWTSFHRNRMNWSLIFGIFDLIKRAEKERTTSNRNFSSIFLSRVWCYLIRSGRYTNLMDERNEEDYESKQNQSIFKLIFESTGKKLSTFEPWPSRLQSSMVWLLLFYLSLSVIMSCFFPSSIWRRHVLTEICVYSFFFVYFSVITVFFPLHWTCSFKRWRLPFCVWCMLFFFSSLSRSLNFSVRKSYITVKSCALLQSINL